jgi:ribosomal protein S18 acetylase RimI-like enzyme
MDGKNNKIIIRVAGEGDLEGILLLIKKLHRNETEKYGNILSLDWVNLHGKRIVSESISDDNNFISVAESEGKIIAFLRGSLYCNEMLWKIGKGAEIYEIFIETKFRNQRIGALLMEVFLDWCSEKKIDYVSINVAARNYEAIKFYENFGFQSNQVILEKKLTKK